MNVPSAWRLPIAVSLLLLAGAVQAQQQRRLTGDPPEAPAATPADPAPATGTEPLPPPASPFTDAVPATSPSPRREVGDATRALLRMQAEGTYAGRALPVLGDQASRSYQRYIDSFEHPIPERFELALPENRSQ